MKADTLSSVEDDLRSTTENIRADLEELQEIEDRKSTRTPAIPTWPD